MIGKSNFQYVQTEGRTKIEQDTKELMQKILDEYGAGVRVAQVQLQRADPPGDVIGAFRDVQAARADKERSINEGNTYRNQVVPRAKGEAASIIQRAEGYKATTVARAKGDVQRFDQVYEQYNKAKDITAERLYLETIEDVLAQHEQGHARQEQHGVGRVLPYLPLPDLRQSAPPPAPRPGPSPSQIQSPGATRMSNRSIVLLVLAAVAIFLLTQTFYTVDPKTPGPGAPVRRPGRPAQDRARPLRQDSAHPGRHRIDRRLLDYEAQDFEIIAGDQKRLVVDAYARYRITNARLYVERVPGGEPTLRGILDPLINSEIRGCAERRAAPCRVDRAARPA